MTTTFRLALPGTDTDNAHIDQLAVDARYPNPKIDTLASPPHAGIIFINWTDTTPIASGTTKIIYSFPHNYSTIPTDFASYKFDNGSNILRGVLPFSNGVLGVIFLDADEKNINLKYLSTDVGTTVIPAFTMQVRFYVMSEHGYE
jgi:hypothetical protein